MTELGLAELGYDTIVFRPGILAGTNRGETRLGESIASYVRRIVFENRGIEYDAVLYHSFFTGIGSHFTSSLQIQVCSLSYTLRRLGPQLNAIVDINSSKECGLRRQTRVSCTSCNSAGFADRKRNWTIHNDWKYRSHQFSQRGFLTPRSLVITEK